MVIKVGQFPGSQKEVTLPEGASVSDAIEAAGFSADGFEVRKNYQPANGDASLEDGDSVTMYRNVKGN